jgi:hypothetical protein
MCAHGEAATWTRARIEGAAMQGGALAHPGDAMSRGAVPVARSVPVVRDLEVE